MTRGKNEAENRQSGRVRFRGYRQNGRRCGCLLGERANSRYGLGRVSEQRNYKAIGWNVSGRVVRASRGQPSETKSRIGFGVRDRFGEGRLMAELSRYQKRQVAGRKKSEARKALAELVAKMSNTESNTGGSGRVPR